MWTLGTDTELHHFIDLSSVVSRVSLSRLRCLELLLRAGAHVNKTNRSGKNAVTLHFTGTEPVNKQALLLLLAAGERLKTRRLAGYPLTWDKNYSHVVIPDHLMYKRNSLGLKHMCRDVIRKHLVKVSNVNLFTRAPRLGLPSVLTSYILYDVSLDLWTWSKRAPKLGLPVVLLYTTYILYDLDLWICSQELLV